MRVLFFFNEIVENRSDRFFFIWTHKKFFNNLPQRKYFQLIRYLSLKEFDKLLNCVYAI